MRSLLLLSTVWPLCLGAIFQDASQLPKTDYDFVVVGAGAGGAVVANRLSEDSKTSVLLIEAGISNEDVLLVQIPLLAPLLAQTEVDWNYTTTNQAGMNNRTIPYPRGKVLGGSTSINYIIWTRGPKDDFDRYANVTGDSGWSWESLQPYILKTERIVAPADDHNTTGQWDPAIHGQSGILPLSLPGYPASVDERVIQTTQELSEFPFIEDMNSGNMIGVGWTQATIANGTRYSSAVGYLAPQFVSRPNLHVLINSQVTRVLQTGQNNGVPAFHTVEFAANAKSPRQQVRAEKEIILSAGSVGTPQILQLSGIGDEHLLSSLGIKTLVNLPGVGQNMSDHALLPNVFMVNSTQTYDDIYRNATVMTENIAQWNASHQGPLVNTVASTIGWGRLADNDTIYENFTDPSSGPTAPHWEFLFGNNADTPYVAPPATGNYMNIVTNVVSPSARGWVNIHSSDPFTSPLINPNLLGTAFDLHTVVEAVKAAKRFLSASVWDDYVLQPFGALATAESDSQLEEYAKDNTFTVWHPVGTASMSPKGASYGVVDPDLLVKGASGLRVVDASVIPYIPAAHTQAPVYIFAERAADLIKAAWS